MTPVAQKNERQNRVGHYTATEAGQLFSSPWYTFNREVFVFKGVQAYGRRRMMGEMGWSVGTGVGGGGGAGWGVGSCLPPLAQILFFSGGPVVP